MLENKITRISFFLSLTAHLLFLSLPAINSLTSNKLLPMKIEVRMEKYAPLPKINRIGEKKKLKKAEQKPEQKPPVQNQMTLINPAPSKLSETKDTAEEAMLRYQDIVKQRIEEKREYSSYAKNHGIEGIVHLRFTILSDGQTEKIEIAKSSGYKILDQSAVNTVRKANPFPPFPEEMNVPYIQIEVNLVYTLKEFR